MSSWKIQILVSYCIKILLTIEVQIYHIIVSINHLLYILFNTTHSIFAHVIYFIRRVKDFTLSLKQIQNVSLSLSSISMTRR